MRTFELIGPALDWAVAKCLGVGPRYNMDSHGRVWAGWWIATPEYEPLPRYSTDWSQGGPIIDREKITIRHWSNEPFITAYGFERGSEWMHGPTPLVAAMRCYVASKLGDEVEIPVELQQQ